VEGTPFGRYRLIELLGRGGMGEVWRAFDTATDRIVALKVLAEYLSQDEVFQRRFRREAHAAAGLNSPHVIPIHFYGEIDGSLFVDMRLIEGRDLQTVLADGPLEPTRAVRIIEQVAKALHAAHKVGLVHRDVKPSNILLDEDDYAYLIDFGIARAAGETGLTATGGVIGSWHYMAPERFSAKEADARADVYALACVLYECLTGLTPYLGDSLEQQYAGHVATPPPRPSSTNPNLPAEFDSVTDKGLAKDPDQRFATTVELARAARDATTVPIPRPTPSPPTLVTTEPAENRVSGQPTTAEAESLDPTEAAPRSQPAPGAAIRARGISRQSVVQPLSKQTRLAFGAFTIFVVALLVGIVILGYSSLRGGNGSPAGPGQISSETTSNAAPTTSTTSTGPGRQYTYAITGTKAAGDIITVTYVDASGQRRTQNNVYIPWSMTITPTSNDVGSVEASSLFRTSRLNCSITSGDGTVLSSNFNDSPQASC
jgi:serine/threonine protein kinase